MFKQLVAPDPKIVENGDLVIMSRDEFIIDMVSFQKNHQIIEPKMFDITANRRFMVIGISKDLSKVKLIGLPVLPDEMQTEDAIGDLYNPESHIAKQRFITLYRVQPKAGLVLPGLLIVISVDGDKVILRLEKRESFEGGYDEILATIGDDQTEIAKVLRKGDTISPSDKVITIEDCYQIFGTENVNINDVSGDGKFEVVMISADRKRVVLRDIKEFWQHFLDET